MFGPHQKRIMESEHSRVHALCFYASVEQRDAPELRGQPVIVGGSPDRRGVVATCSYEARQFGIHSAMPSRTALKLCPHAVFLLPQFDHYRAVSAQIMDIFHRYTDLVEPLSLDEAYLDVTENKNGLASATQIARSIKQEIHDQIYLTASAGVSFNKFLAKLGSAYRKPDGLTVITPEQSSAFLEATHVQKFFGIGKVTESRLAALGVSTGADLKLLSETQLREVFGERGSMFYQFVRGRDERPVQPVRERKSVGKETTLAVDISDQEQIMRLAQDLSIQVEHRLVELGMYGKTITLKVKWSNFQQITRSVTVPTPLQQSALMMPFLRSLYAELANAHKPVRLLGVTISHLLSAEAESQRATLLLPSLWDTSEGE